MSGLTCLETRPWELGGWQALYTDRPADRSCWLPQELCTLPAAASLLSLHLPVTGSACGGLSANTLASGTMKLPRKGTKMGCVLGVAGPCVTWAETRSLRGRAKAGEEQGMNAPSASLTDSGCSNMTHSIYLQPVEHRVNLNRFLPVNNNKSMSFDLPCDSHLQPLYKNLNICPLSGSLRNSCTRRSLASL